jgi:hypothetical protein
MGRPAVLSPAQREQIRAWVLAGKTNAQIRGEAAALKWQAGETALSQAAKKCREEPRPAMPTDLEIPPPGAEPDAPALSIHERLARLEAALLSPPSDAAVTIEQAFTDAVAAISRQIKRHDIDPRALAPLVKELGNLAEHVTRLRSAGDDDDSDLEGM